MVNPSSDQASNERNGERPSDYDAFISYGHAVDGRLAPALQSALQRFAKPWYRLRSLRIFRDEATLSANPALWPSIEEGLDRSRWFILLASPSAASSRWVTQEAEHWLRHKPADRILLVLSEGELAWEDPLRRFDPDRTDSLPAPLLDAFDYEPRWVDVRWARSRDELTLRDPRFRAAIAELAAPLHDRPKDELIGEEIRQHRRNVRLARAVVAGLAALAIAAAVAAFLAVRGQAAARAERDRAEEQARLATSRQLAAHSGVALRANELDLALLLAAHSFQLRATAEAWDSLVAALNAVPRLERIVPTAPAIYGAISDDGRVVAVAGRERLEVRSVVADGRARRSLPLRGEIAGVGISPEGSVVATGDRRGAVTVYDLTRTGRRRLFPGLRVPPGEEGPFQATSFAIAPHGDLVAWNGAQITVWNGRRRQVLSPGVKPGSWLLAFGARGRKLAAASDSDGTVVVWTLNAGRPVGRSVSFNAGSGAAPAGFGQGVASIAFSPRDPSLIAVGGIDGTVAFWTESGKLLEKRQARHAIGDLAFSDDGRFLAAIGERTTVWDVARRRPIASLPRYSEGRAVAFLRSDRVATVGANAVAVWNLVAAPSQLARRLDGPDRGIQRVAYDASGARLATLDDRGSIRLWDGSTLRPAGPALAAGWQTIDLALSPDGDRVAAWRPLAKPPLTLWDLGDGERHDVRDIPDVADVAFTRDGDAVAATYAAAGIELWHVSPPKFIRRLSSSRGAGVARVASGATAVAAATAEGSEITLWNAQTGAVLRRIPDAAGVLGFGFAEDGRLLVTSNWRDSTITLWNAVSGARVGRLTGARVSRLTNAPAPDAIALDHTSRRLAALTSDGIRFWDLAEREPRGSNGLVAPTNESFENEPQLVFAPDGRSLVVIGLGATPLVFAHEASWPAIACGLAGSQLTRSEWSRYVGPGFDYETCER